jgi:arginyl-tRNA synthetase
MFHATVDFGENDNLAEQEEIQRRIKLEEQKLNLTIASELEKNPEASSRAIAERVVEQLKDGPLEWDVADLSRAVAAKRKTF